MDQNTINSLLEKFRDNTISPDEQHILEKAALDDPFLFDALQGYHNLNNINKTNSKTSSSVKKLIPYLAAASFLIVVSFAWLYFNKSSEAELISMNNQEMPQTVGTPAQESLNTDVVDNNSTSTNDAKIENKSLPQKSKIPPPQASTPTGPSNNKSQPTSSDIVNNDAMAEPSLADEVKSAPEAEAKSKEVPLAEPLETVKSTAKSKASKADESSEELKDKYIYSQSVLDETAVYPMMGKDNLNNFIKKNKIVPSYAFTYNFKGSVTVKFTVNKDGTLSDFINENEDCPDCGEEVIRLLKKSGKWATIPKGIKKETSITVKF